jgi:HEAT repeat protein
MLKDVLEERPREGAAPVPTPPSERSRRLGPAVLVPLLLVLLAAGIVLFFGLLSLDSRSPHDLLEEVRNAPGERRAMAAFELSRLERYDIPPAARAAFVSRAVQTFEGEAGGDSRIRRSLALTLGRLGDRLAVDSLIRALEDPDPETRLYSVWALGALRDSRASSPLMEKLHEEDPAVRKMAAFSLGLLEDRAAVPALRIALADPAADVSWNAAISLARLGDSASLPVLLPLLDPSWRGAGMPARRQEELKINVLRSLRGLPGEPAASAIRRAAGKDPSARVRGEARRILEEPSP